MTCKGIRIFLAPTLALAKALMKDIKAALTIEAEYGDKVVKGVRYTAAHHGPRKNNPAPCVDGKIPVLKKSGDIIVSHLDLDTIGGIALAMGREWPHGYRTQDFWDIAAFVDTNGPHLLREFYPRISHHAYGVCGMKEDEGEAKGSLRHEGAVAKLYAYWAYSKNAARYSREQVTDVTDDVRKTLEVIDRILKGDSELLDAGLRFKEEEKILDQLSYRMRSGRVIYRVTDEQFVNHLYNTPGNGALPSAQAVVAWNKGDGSITVSLAEPVPGVSCREIVQKLWGAEAGGHDGIAGSPRGRTMTEAEAMAAFCAMQEVINKGVPEYFHPGKRQA